MNSQNPQKTINTTRRSFLKTTVLAAAAPALIGLIPRVRAQVANEGKMGVALCGLGGFSGASIAPELPVAKNVYFAGVITGSPETKGKAWAKQYGFSEKNIFTYADMARLADCKEIEIVHVVTPNSLHAPHSIAAAQAGKHVMCEKPMATTPEECEAIIEAAKKAGVMLGVDYRLHFEPHHQEMIRLAQQQIYGAVKTISSEFSWHRGNGKPWLLDIKMAGGGTAFDTGVYSVQAGSYITGETPIRATAVPTTTRDVYPKGIEETMSFTLEYPGGAVMQGRASYAYGAENLDVHAEKGTFSCTGKSFSQSVHGKPSPKKVILPNGAVENIPDTLQLAVLHDEFASAIRDKRPFACPGEMGLRDIRILKAIYESVAQGGKSVPVVA